MSGYGKYILERFYADYRNSLDFEEFVKFASYILATVYHETAGTMKPIEEINKGRGRRYGRKDHKTGKVYYGRGFIQLTWKENYERFSRLLKIDLVNNPDKLLEPEVSVVVLLRGMIEGLFTGKRLEEFLGKGKKDYYRARKVVNNLDKADVIARYALKIEPEIRKEVKIWDLVASQGKEPKKHNG